MLVIKFLLFVTILSKMEADIQENKPVKETILVENFSKEKSEKVSDIDQRTSQQIEENLPDNTIDADAKKNEKTLKENVPHGHRGELNKTSLNSEGKPEGIHINREELSKVHEGLPVPLVHPAETVKIERKGSSEHHGVENKNVHHHGHSSKKKLIKVDAPVEETKNDSHEIGLPAKTPKTDGMETNSIQNEVISKHESKSHTKTIDQNNLPHLAKEPQTKEMSNQSHISEPIQNLNINDTSQVSHTNSTSEKIEEIVKPPSEAKPKSTIIEEPILKPKPSSPSKSGGTVPKVNVFREVRMKLQSQKANSTVKEETHHQFQHPQYHINEESIHVKPSEKYSSAIIGVSLTLIFSTIILTIVGIYYRKISLDRRRYVGHEILSTEDDEISLFNRDTYHDDEVERYASWNAMKYPL